MVQKIRSSKKDRIFYFTNPCNKTGKPLFCNNIFYQLTGIMQNRYTQLVLSLVAIIFTFSSCKKDFSPDEPLEETFTPSIFIGSQNQHLYALDPSTGTKKWEFFTDGGIYGSPMVWKDWVFVPTENGRIFKLDAKHGTLVKTYFLEGQIWATPTSDGD